MIQTLLDDHAHMLLALDVLEQQYTRIVGGKSPDIDLMLNVVVYLQEYSEQVHHPMEDAIFSVLLKRDASSGKQLRELIRDHTSLEKITRRLRETLDNLKDDKRAKIDLLDDIIPTLLARLKQHLQYEEDTIFPMVDRVMTRLDWENIRSKTPGIDDPVFGKQPNNDYKPLYEALNIS